MGLIYEVVTFLLAIRLAKKDLMRNQPVVIRLISRKTKIHLLKNAYKLKPTITKGPNIGAALKDTGIFINEHLTPQNATIARKARSMKKEKER